VTRIAIYIYHDISSDISCPLYIYIYIYIYIADMNVCWSILDCECAIGLESHILGIYVHVCTDLKLTDFKIPDE